MHGVALDLLILLTGIWLVAVTLKPLGLPTVMGELIVGVLLGPAVLGWITPNEAITLLNLAAARRRRQREKWPIARKIPSKEKTLVPWVLWLYTDAR
jgi:polyferredoxin